MDMLVQTNALRPTPSSLPPGTRVTVNESQVTYVARDGAYEMERAGLKVPTVPPDDLLVDTPTASGFAAFATMPTYADLVRFQAKEADAVDWDAAVEVTANTAAGAEEVSEVDTAGLNTAGVAEVSTADFTGLTAAAMGNTHFLLSGAAANFYVWFNLDAGGVDPAVAGRTALEVAISTGDSATTMGAAAASVINANAAFGATANTGVVTITDAATGARTDPVDVDSGVVLLVTTPGVTAITAAALNNKYFTIHGAADAAFHVWFNVAAGGTDPEPADSTGIEVTLAADDTDDEIATAIQTAVDAHASFVATVLTSVVEITDAAKAFRTAIAAGNSGAAVSVTTRGVPAGIAQAAFTGLDADTDYVVRVRAEHDIFDTEWSETEAITTEAA